MSNNLYKWGYVSVDPEDVRVIDSNERLAKKLGDLPGMDEGYQDMAMDYEMPEFEEGQVVDDGMGALFGEPDAYMDSQEAFDEGAYEQSGQDNGEFEAGLDAQQHILSAQQAEEIIRQAEQQAEDILQQAQEKAQTLTNQAYEQAKIQGHQDGYQEGIGRAQNEIDAKTAELEEFKRQLQMQYEEQLSEMEPYLVMQLSAIYEHLIGVELSQHKNVLMHLIDHTLHNTEAAQSYLIHVSEHDYSYVSMQKGQLLAEGGQENATLEVIEDKTLSKNQCLIETESGIFDCSLTVQLEELKRKLMLLAYNQKGV